MFDGPAFDLRGEVLETSQDLLRAEVFVGPRGNGGPLHRHLRQKECFHVLEGALRVRQGLRESRIVEAGEEVGVPAGRPHTFRVLGDGAHFIAEFRPAYDIAEVFRDVFALSSRSRGGGQPKPRDAAALIQRYPDDFFYLAYVPIGLQRALARLLVRPSD